MEKDLSNFRKSYEKQELLESNINENPMELFKEWFDQLDTIYDEVETNAMTISTIGSDGYPKGRVVLLKKFTDEGFIFFTNYESEKGKDISKNANVCLSFYWPQMERQVIIKGQAEKIAKNLSDAYFDLRPRGSQLGAWASHQSEVVRDRNYLEDKLKQLEIKYMDKKIPRPTHWGGYIIKPVELEFWQGRTNRLHDRIRFNLDRENNWMMCRLSP